MFQIPMHLEPRVFLQFLLKGGVPVPSSVFHTDDSTTSIHQSLYTDIDLDKSEGNLSDQISMQMATDR